MPLVNEGTTGVHRTYVLNARTNRNPMSLYETPAQRYALTSHENSATIVIRAGEWPIKRHGEICRNKQGRSDAKHG